MSRPAVATPEQAYIQSLPRSARRELATALGFPADRDTTIDAVATALADPAKRRAAVATLPLDARVLLRALHVWPRLPHAPIATAWQGLSGWPAERTEAAYGALTRAGLACALEKQATATPPAFAAIECVEGLEDYCRGLAGEPPRSSSFLLALVWTLIREQTPAFTQQGRAHARWLDRTAAFLSVPESRVHELVGVLLRPHAVVVREPGNRMHLFADLGAAEELFSIPPADLALLAASSDSVTGLADVPLERALRTHPGADAVSYDAIVAAVSALSEEGRLPFRLHAPVVSHGLATLYGAGLVAFEDGGRLWRRASPPAAEGRWVVQPNLDVLVPQDAPPSAVAALGAFADVTRLDAVSTFTLRKESVRAGGAFQLSAERMLEILAAHAAAPIPENVAAMLRGWARRSRPMRHWVGAVLVAQDEEQAALLRSDPRMRDEIAPNVFAFGERDAARAITEAQRAGVSVDPRDYERPSSLRTSAIDETASIRERIASSGAPPKNVKKPTAAPPKPSVPPPAPAAPEELPAGTWRALYRLRKYPNIQAFAREHPRFAEALASIPARDLRLLNLVPPDEIEQLLRSHPDFQEDDDNLYDEGEDEDDLDGDDGLDDGDEEDEDEDDLDDDDDGLDEGDEDLDDDDNGLDAQLRTLHSAQPASQPPPTETAWSTPAPGVLRSILTRAIADDRTLEILYVSAKGERVTHIVAPQSLSRRAGHEWLDALVQPAGFRSTFRLDRIAALRTP